MTAGSGIDRAGVGDLMTLAADHGRVPMNIGAVLVLEGCADLDLATLTTVFGARIGTVPRLRQRLRPTPLGCGRPVWVDDPRFELTRHLSTRQLAAPGTWACLLEAAAAIACERLDTRRPPWAVRLVTGLDGGRAALLIVMHHVLADGIGGLAVLAALADPPGRQDAATRSAASALHRAGQFPMAPPTRAALAQDALSSRMKELARLPRVVGTLAGGVRELGLGLPRVNRPAPRSAPRSAHRPFLAPVTSLNEPTGDHRRLTTVQVRRAEVLEAAHRDQCTVNDLVVAAVTGALAATLWRRGENPTDLVVSIPVSTRRAATVTDLGNHTGVLPLRVPLTGTRDDRLRRTAALTSEWRRHPRGRSAGPLAGGFRLLGALGAFQSFVDHQRFVNTFVSNVRGPQESLAVAGHPVLAVIPLAVVPGNVGVAFEVLSYADQLVITVVADPRLVPDQDFLTDVLTTELELLVGVRKSLGE